MLSQYLYLYVLLGPHNRCHGHSQNHQRLQLPRRRRLVRLRIPPHQLLLPALLRQTLRRIPRQVGFPQRAAHIRNRVDRMRHGTELGGLDRGKGGCRNRRRWDCFWHIDCESRLVSMEGSMCFILPFLLTRMNRFSRGVYHCTNAQNTRAPWEGLSASRRLLRPRLEASLLTKSHGVSDIISCMLSSAKFSSFKMVLLDQPPARRRHTAHGALPRQNPGRSQSQDQRHVQRVSRPVRSRRHADSYPLGHLSPSGFTMGWQRIRLEFLENHSSSRLVCRPLRTLATCSV